MESYEVEINGRTFPVKPVKSISGHDIKQYRIHGGKSIPFLRTNDQTKMEEGEVFAVETFGSTGRGYTRDGVRSPLIPIYMVSILTLHQPGVYGYGRDPFGPKRVTSPLASARSLYKTINDNFGTLVFSRRYLERLGVERYLAGVSHEMRLRLLNVVLILDR